MTAGRRVAWGIAWAALGWLSLGGTCTGPASGPDYFFRAPAFGQLSLPGPVDVDLRIPGAADVGTLQLYVDDQPVTLESPTTLPDGIAGTVSLPGGGEGNYVLKAEIDDPGAPGEKLVAFAGVQIVDLYRPDECEVLNNEECLLPYPSSRFLVAAGGGPGNDVRVNLPAIGMPLLSGGRLKPDPINEFDGFSPTVQILMHFPAGVDLEQSKASRLLAPGCCGQLNQTPYRDVRTHKAGSLRPDSPSVLMDADTGERILHFLELDARAAGNPQRQVLFMRPAESLVPGHRYIVAMRKLVDPQGDPVMPEPAFRALRTGTPTTIQAIEDRRAEAADIFQRLEANGVERNSLILAFDFVVRSEHQLTHEILTMRDETLGDIDSDPSAFLPNIDLASHAAFNAANVNDCGVPGTQVWRHVKATVDVPNYLAGVMDDTTTPFLNVDGSGNPVQNTTAGQEYSPANYDFLIPCSVFNGGLTVRPLTLGHGLFGNGEGMIGSVEDGLMDEFADDEFPYIAGATDWRGLSSFDYQWIVSRIIGIYPHQLDNFPALSARLKQGMLSTLVLSHLMKGTLLNQFEEFQKTPGNPATGVFPGSGEDEFYVGASLGGIMGLFLSALTPDIERFNIDVGAINFSILLQRSTQFSDFETLLQLIGLDEPMVYALGLGLLHEIWVNAEPAGYVRHVTGLVEDPLPDLEGQTMDGKRILMTVAWLDKQVSNQASEIAARALGIPSLQGSLLQGLAGIPDQPEGPSGLDSALVFYDVGSFDVFDPAYDPYIPPLTNEIPSAVCDPHGLRFSIPASVEQLVEFLRPGGTVRNFCTDDGVCNASENFERPGGVDESSLCDPLP